MSEQFYGEVTKCKGVSCGEDIIFVEYFHKKENKMKKTPVNAIPILCLVPYISKDSDPRISEQLVPEKWNYRKVFVPHHTTCKSVEQFKRNPAQYASRNS